MTENHFVVEDDITAEEDLESVKEYEIFEDDGEEDEGFTVKDIFLTLLIFIIVGIVVALVLAAIFGTHPT